MLHLALSVLPVSEEHPESGGTSRGWMPPYQDIFQRQFFQELAPAPPPNQYRRDGFGTPPPVDRRCGRECHWEDHKPARHHLHPAEALSEDVRVRFRPSFNIVTGDDFSNDSEAAGLVQLTTRSELGRWHSADPAAWRRPGPCAGHDRGALD
jgi:hypothetical protein